MSEQKVLSEYPTLTVDGIPCRRRLRRLTRSRRCLPVADLRLKPDENVPRQLVEYLSQRGLLPAIRASGPNWRGLSIPISTIVRRGDRWLIALSCFSTTRTSACRRAGSLPSLESGALERAGRSSCPRAAACAREVRVVAGLGLADHRLNAQTGLVLDQSDRRVDRSLERREHPCIRCLVIISTVKRPLDPLAIGFITAGARLEAVF